MSQAPVVGLMPLKRGADPRRCRRDCNDCSGTISGPRQPTGVKLKITGEKRHNASGQNREKMILVEEERKRDSKERRPDIGGPPMGRHVYEVNLLQFLHIWKLA